MKFALFLIFILASFQSYSAVTLNLAYYESKNVEFEKEIDSCSPLYNTIEFVCGNSNIFINMKDSNNAERILILFRDGTRELVNVRRKRSEIRDRVRLNRMNSRKNPDSFRMRYSFSLSERLGRTKYFQRRHRLSITNSFGKLFWNINLTTVENSFTKSRGESTRVYFNTTLRYKNLKIYFGEASVMPMRGSSLMSSRIYGADVLYKDRNFFVNTRIGKRGNQYNHEDEVLKSVSFGDMFFDKYNVAFSYADNQDESTSIFGFNLSTKVNNDISYDIRYSDSKNDFDKKSTYEFGLNLRKIHKNKFFSWNSASFRYKDSPDGFINITGNNTNISQNEKRLSNRFLIFIPDNLGSLNYGNNINLRTLGEIKTANNSHYLSYNYDKFNYILNYSEFYNNRDPFVSKRIGNSLSYLKKGIYYDNIFGISHGTLSSKNSITYSTGMFHVLKGSMFSWNNNVQMNQQEIKEDNIVSNFRDNINKNYTVSSSLDFRDLLSLDQLGFGFSSRFQEDQLDNLYNSVNSFRINMRKKINNNHMISLNLGHNVNNTYDGTRKFQTIGFNYVFNFKNQHNLINNIINNRNMTITLFNDTNYDYLFDEGDELLHNVEVEVYESSGLLFGKYTVYNGKLLLKDIDKNKGYFVVIKNNDDLELIKSNFSYDNNEFLMAQSFNKQSVDVKDIQSDERVITAELTVRCFDKKYTRKISGSYLTGYNIKYPKNSDCILQIDSLTNETFYDIEYDEKLPLSSNGVMYITLKRFNKLHGYITDKDKKPIKNKIVKFKGMETKTNAFGYYEFLFNKGEIYGSMNFKKEVLEQSLSLKSCRSSEFLISYYKGSFQEKRVDIFCENK